MLERFFRSRRQPSVGDCESLSRFLDRRAALISQKTIVGYCQVKTNLPLAELARETVFADAFARAQMDAYAAVLADLIVIVAGRLHAAHGGGGEESAALADRLADLFGALLARHPAPATRPAGWGEEIAAVRQRLHEAAAAPARSIAEIARVSARKVFAALPIHETLRRADAPAMEASVRFMFVGMAREFERDLDYPALCRVLLDPAGAPAVT